MAVYYKSLSCNYVGLIVGNYESGFLNFVYKFL